MDSEYRRETRVEINTAMTRTAPAERVIFVTREILLMLFINQFRTETPVSVERRLGITIGLGWKN